MSVFFLAYEICLFIIELAFLFFINIFSTIGLLTFLIFIIYIIKVAFVDNFWVPFCYEWTKYILNPKTYYYSIKNIYQKLRYGICYNDCIDFDRYIIKIFPIALTTLRNDKYRSDIPEKDWNNIIGGFEGYTHIYECTKSDCGIQHNQLRKDLKVALNLFTKYFPLV